MDSPTASIGSPERRLRGDGDGAVNFSRRPGRPTLRTKVDNSISSAQLTPPPTPHTLHFSSDRGPTFHNYLRVLYFFDPAANGAADVQATASIEPGDLVLVHSVHANGWADGTVLTTGVRGWLPTNYCEPFAHSYMTNLLNATTQFWDLLCSGAGAESNFAAFVRQDYIRGLIAGVRYLLEHADCLHRDAPLVQRHTAIRRLRKGLLADLSSLVQIAKRLQEAIGDEFGPEVIHVLLEELMSKVFRVVSRAVGFLDMYTEESELAKQALFAETMRADTLTASMESRSLASSARQSIETNEIIIDRRSEELPAGDAVPDEAVPTTAQEHRQVIEEHNERKTHSRLSSNFSAERDSARFRPQSSMVSHRVSVVTLGLDKNGSLASQRMVKAHDESVSQIAAYIGLHLHSRPSGELVATTERLVEACERMLKVIDQVAAHDTAEAYLAQVQQARVNFRSMLDELIRSTRDAFRFSDRADEEVLMLPDQSTHLVDVGTGLIRRGADCLHKTLQLIEHVGDFDLEDSPSNNADVNDDASAIEAQPPVEAPTEEKQEEDKPIFFRHQKSASYKMLPPIPPPEPSPTRPRAATFVDVNDFAMRSPAVTLDELRTPVSSVAADLRKSLPPVPQQVEDSLVVPTTEPSAIEDDAAKTSDPLEAEVASPFRKASFGTSMSESDTRQTSARDSGITAVSEVSTRATTPDNSKRSSNEEDTALVSSSVHSLSSVRSSATNDASSDAEAQLLQKTYASELTFNKDGQVTGGSLPALVEQLTSHDSAPDSQFLSAFFITFRSFTTPRDLVKVLIERFEYVGDNTQFGTPVRLRICNVFKGWLETYWNPEADRDALGDIRYFAIHKLKSRLPTAGERLIELTRRVTAGYQNGTLIAPMVSGVGKISTSLGVRANRDAVVPESIITKSQHSALQKGLSSRSACSILDLDPLEIARQLTLVASETFNLIQPEELLSLEWSKKDTTTAANVRNMCVLNTDLAHVVADTILTPEDAKKRALIIKHWAKIAAQSLALNNYETLMAIMCSLNSSVIQRLRRTWELVSKKTKARMDELNAIVDFSRNHASLRSRLENPTAPCLPFLGIFLTDLTFIDAGNPRTRELPGVLDEAGNPVAVINFDKHMRMARVVAHLQKFQVPYALHAVPEMQAWIDAYLRRMREGNAEMVSKLHRRSLVVEPKNDENRSLRVFEAGRRSVSGGPIPTLATAATEPLPKPSSGISPRTDTGSSKFELFSRSRTPAAKSEEAVTGPAVENIA